MSSLPNGRLQESLPILKKEIKTQNRTIDQYQSPNNIAAL